jgi:hypothetical protein
VGALLLAAWLAPGALAGDVTLVVQKDGRPAPGVDVVLAGQTVTSDADARVRFEGVADGVHDVHVALPPDVPGRLGGVTPAASIEVRGDVVDLKIAVPEPATLAGVVLDAATDTPLDGARVEVRVRGSTAFEQATTAADGRFAFAVDPRVDLEVLAVRAGY